MGMGQAQLRSVIQTGNREELDEKTAPGQFTLFIAPNKCSGEDCRGLSPSELLHFVDIGAADALFTAIVKAGAPVTGIVAVEAGDRLAAKDHRAVGAYEQSGVQILLQLGNGAVDQPTALTDMKS